MKKKEEQPQQEQPKEGTELEKLRKDYDELKELLQRTHAEFQNYVKRSDEDKKSFIAIANEQLIRKLLPILDHFELALKNKETEEFHKGVLMIHDQLRQLLEEEGLTPIPATGKFDVTKHEALLAEESDEEPNTIIGELQRGYTLGNKVVRTSKVKIAKNGGKAK